VKKILSLFCVLFVSCNTGNLVVVSDLPKSLHEASGIEKLNNSDLIWMINDSGNKSILYGLDTLGVIKKQLKIKAKNHDWEELTKDKSGNLYIGDFGNNANKRKNLVILKVMNYSLKSSKAINVDKISFYYPEQKKFPPKANKMHFDSESFFHYNDSLFLFTKSRTKTDLGKTNLYKIPAKKGNHKAQFVSSFTTCSEHGCWITSADINEAENKIALLTEHSVFIFENFNSSDFFSGSVKQYPFNYDSQKESVIFKNDTLLYITDERSGPKGGNIYTLKIE
jgi:hypothetical protein